MTPAIIGLAGLTLSADERAVIRDASPAGFILFGRNIQDRAQLRALTDELRAVAGRDALPILIDQEGGRVARLGPPHWPAFPAPALLGRLYERAPITAIAAARANAAAIALTLAEVGITVAAAPLLDLTHPCTHGSIGDRSFSANPLAVAALGKATLAGLADGGVVGIVKHMPGQGRAGIDSHVALPVIDAEVGALREDLAPFAALASAPIGMTTHAVLSAFDAGCPATLSPTVIAQVVRGILGFDGLLLTDDITMGALSGSEADRAEAAIVAGCDIVLHCSGKLRDAAAVLARIDGAMTAAAHARLDRAMALPAVRTGESIDALLARRDAYLARAS